MESKRKRENKVKPFKSLKERATTMFKHYLSIKLEELLFKALEKDNTNNKILFSYLKYIKKNQKQYFKKELLFRQLFLTQAQLIYLSPNSLFSIKTHKEIFQKFIESIKVNNFQDSYKQHYIHCQLFNPYKVKQLDDETSFIYNNDKYRFYRDIRPRFCFTIKTEEDFFKYVLYMMENKKDKIIKLNFLYHYGFIIIETLYKQEVEFTELITLLQIMLLASPFKLLNFYKYLKKKYKLNVELPKKEKKEEQDGLESISDEELDEYVELSLGQSFVPKIKVYLFKFLRAIIDSKCIIDLLHEIYPEMDENDLAIFDESFINYAEDITKFEGLFNERLFGNYNYMINQILINQCLRYSDRKYGNGLLFLLHTGVFLITLLHEIIGHFSRRYFFSIKHSNIISNLTDRKIQTVIDNSNSKKDNSFIAMPIDWSEMQIEGGSNIETLLFGSERTLLSARQAIYILDIRSWDFNISKFRNDFCLYNKTNLTVEEIDKLLSDEQVLFGTFRNTVNKDKPLAFPNQMIEYVMSSTGSTVVEQTINIGERLCGYSEKYNYSDMY